MKCQKCASERVASISGKHSDSFSMSCPVDGINIQGDYAPEVRGICGGDYTTFSVCLDCGQVQGKFPVQVRVR